MAGGDGDKETLAHDVEGRGGGLRPKYARACAAFGLLSDRLNPILKVTRASANDT
jgi:hypothetical protein